MRVLQNRGATKLKAAVKLTVACCSLAFLPGCASIFYSKTPTGSFSGKLTVEWIAPNQFIYRPDPDKPLIYRSADGQQIQPQLMYTDAGSIPRLFWSAPELGPWDFGPGYIIHDWLFDQHHCRIGDWQQYDLQRAAEVLAEAMKTQIQQAPKPEPVIIYAVYEAVRSPVAKRLWDKPGCNQPAALSAPAFAPQSAPVVIMTIDFN